MAVWAIAWAGSKPLASLTDGLLAGWIGVRWTGAALALPALIPIAVMIFAPNLGHLLVGNRTRGGETESKPEPEPMAAFTPAAGSKVTAAVS